jgi:hypothetical protein
MNNVRQKIESLLRNASRSLLLVGVLCIPCLPHAQELYDDDEVKAAYIYHFATFAVWPTVEPEASEFLIAVMGANEVAAELERFSPGQQIGGRPLRIARVMTPEDLDALDHLEVLFIGDQHNGTLEQLVRSVEDRSVLVVTDAPDALDYGSMINFELVDNRLRFEVSLTAVRRAGLDLSSRLLSAAKFVDTTSALPATSPLLHTFAAIKQHLVYGAVYLFAQISATSPTSNCSESPACHTAMALPLASTSMSGMMAKGQVSSLTFSGGLHTGVGSPRAYRLARITNFSSTSCDHTSNALPAASTATAGTCSTG